MKSILLLVHPDILVNILNGKADILIKKLFPKDYVGWVYLYCSKCSKKNHHLIEVIDTDIPDAKSEYEIDYYIGGYKGWQNDCLDGKVIARFWCDKVEDIRFIAGDILQYYETDTINGWKIHARSQIDVQDMAIYLGFDEKCGYAIHISKLEVFEKPRELSKFKRKVTVTNQRPGDPFSHSLTYLEALEKAPKNYCYIESTESDK